MSILYTAHATTKAGRNGHSETSDSTLKVDLSTPKEMGGEGKTGATNPEQLFAMGYSACFGGAVGAVAKSKGLKIADPQVTAHVGFGKEEATGFYLEVKLEVVIEGLDKTQTDELVKAADQVCPYSKAIRGNVNVTFA